MGLDNSQGSAGLGGLYLPMRRCHEGEEETESEVIDAACMHTQYKRSVQVPRVLEMTDTYIYYITYIHIYIY